MAELGDSHAQAEGGKGPERRVETGWVWPTTTVPEYAQDEVERSVREGERVVGAYVG